MGMECHECVWKRRTFQFGPPEWHAACGAYYDAGAVGDEWTLWLWCPHCRGRIARQDSDYRGRDYGTT